MRLVVCAIHDSKVGAFAIPFSSRSRGEALRSFSDACQDTNMGFHKHPNDYALYIVGEFDDGSGELIATQPVRLASATDFVVKPPELPLLKAAE